MRANWTTAISFSLVVAAVASAAPAPSPDKLGAMRQRLDDLRITAVAPPASNCGDVVPLASLGVAPPPPGALPGSTATYYFTPGTLHLQAVAIVQNAGRQPSGGTEAFQTVTVTQRLTGFAGETELLRARFRPLAAGAAQRFPFTIRVPFNTSTYRPYTPGPMTVTTSVALSFDKRAPVTLRPADCVMSNNVLVSDLRLW
jgi:hypothetical protein